MRFVFVFGVGLVVACALLFQSFLAHAMPVGCYSLSEAEAEQGIRIHSELMIIGLNCQHMTPQGQQNLYAQYRDITQKNAGLFSGYEDVLIDYFRKTGLPDPERALHDLRTNLANRISSDAAQMRPDVFCRQYSPRLEQASAMAQGDIQRWAATFYPSHPVSRPMCESVTR